MRGEYLYMKWWLIFKFIFQLINLFLNVRDIVEIVFNIMIGM